MSCTKFKVGDRVVVAEAGYWDLFYKPGAEGVVIDQDEHMAKVRFVSGDFDTKDGVWWARHSKLRALQPYSASFTKKSEREPNRGHTTDGGGLQKHSVGELYPLAVVGYCNGGATTFVVEDLQSGAVVCDWLHLDCLLWKYAKVEDAIAFARSVPNRGCITFVYQRPSFVNDILSI